MARTKRSRAESSRPAFPDPQKAAPPAAARRPRPALVASIAVALIVAVLVSYGGLLSGGFLLYDDTAYVTQNIHVHQGLARSSVSWAFTTTTAANWHPLTWLSHMLDVQLFGLDAGRHHLISILLHALNAILLFLLLVRMTGALWRSAFVAALFALHPLHVESVAWIAERKDVLSTLFWLLTTGAWLAYVKSKKTAPYAGMLAFFALGLMAKPMLVTLPFTLLLLDYWPLQRLAFPLKGRSAEIRKLVWEKAPLFAMSAASCILTLLVQRTGGAVKTAAVFPLAQRTANAAHAYLSYLGKTFWPHTLAVFYPHAHTGLFAPSTTAAFLALACITAATLRLWKKAPWLTFGWLWYLGTLVPVIGFVQVGDQAMADRYTYVPLIGIFIAIAWGLAEAVKTHRLLRRCIAATAAMLLAALCIVTRVQTRYWSDDTALFSHALQVTRDNAVAHSTLGVVLYQKGRTKEAIAHYAEALRIDPNYAEVHNNLGLALVADGRLEAAIAQFHEALQLLPHAKNAGKALNNLGAALVKLNRVPEAMVWFQQAVQVDPDFPEAQGNLGDALARIGRLEDAVEHYREALRLQPDSAKTLDSLGVALARLNRAPEAMERFEQAVRLAPDFAQAHYDLAITLARTGRLEDARRRFQKALKINPGFNEARIGLENVEGALRTNRRPD